MRPSSGRCSGPAPSPRWAERPPDEVRGRAGRPRAARAHPPSAALVDGRRGRSTRSGTSSPGTSPTRRMPRARRVVAPRRRGAGGSRRRPATGSRTSPRSSPTTTPRRSTSRSRSATTRSPRSCGPPALRFLLLAGKRALGLDLPVALGLLERALALAPAGHPDRATVLEPYGDGLSHDGRYRDAVAAYEEAIDLFRSAGQIRAAGAVMGKLARDLRVHGRSALSDLTARGRRPAGAARSHAGARHRSPPARHLATSSHRGSRRRSPASIERSPSAERASSPASATRSSSGPRSPAGAASRGVAMGDLAGADEVERGDRDPDRGRRRPVGHGFRINLAIVTRQLRSRTRSDGRLEDALAFGRARGLRADLAWLEMGILQARYDLGEHDRLLADFAATRRASSRRRERRRSSWTCACVDAPRRRPARSGPRRRAAGLDRADGATHRGRGEPERRTRHGQPRPG